ncbi:Protein LSM14 homolog B, partial [Geodia barretti]
KPHRSFSFLPLTVRSYGTEGRQVPKPIPPRTETYEFIIFRGSDIKDLHVSEIQAKTEQQDPAPQDPAILSATSQAPVPPPATNEPTPPSSSAPSSSQPLFVPQSQHPTYSQFPPAPSGFPPFNIPYFKPAMMMGAGGPAGVQRPPHIPPIPTPQHPLHPLPLSSHQPFPPFMPGQVPIPLSHKSPFVPPNLPSSFAPLISTIMRPSPGVIAEGKSQSPVASSTPQTTTGLATDTHTTSGDSTTPAQTTPQAASESESPLARMNHVSPPSQVTQAPPPSSLSHLPPSLDSAPPSAPGQGTSHTTTTAGNVNQQHQPTTTLQTHGGGGGDEEKESLLKQGRDSGDKAPLISEPPPQTTAERRNSAGTRGRDRSRGRGGRRNFRAGPHSWSRGGGPPNQHEPTYRYENDFDFESANAQFDKQVLEEEFKKLRVGKSKSAAAESGTPSATPTTGRSVSEDVGGVVEEEEVEEGEVIDEPEPEEFYDKTKSFFDSISCENPGGSRYTNRNEERELNTETFGVSSVNSLRRGRGRWRGGGRGRGRGGYVRRDYYYGRGGGSRGGRGGRREDGRDGGSRDTREDRPPRRLGSHCPSAP